jgi:CHASE2 domain-containing sensor protein
MNRKKREVVEQEGLDNDEEEVEDLHTTRNIGDILHTTYERKTRGYGSNTEEGSPFHIRITMEPTTPYVTNTSEEEKSVNQQVISDRIIFIGHGSSGN